MLNNEFFPDIILRLPEADIPVEGVTGYLMQGDTQQIVFMSFSRDAEIPEHSHEAQWGVIIDGEIELTVDGKTRVLGRGDTYFIPGGVGHSAHAKKGYKDITLFDQVDRYPIKQKNPNGT